MDQLQPLEASIPSQDSISAPNDERRSGSRNDMCMGGAIQYLQEDESLREAVRRYHFSSLDRDRDSDSDSDSRCACMSMFVQKVKAPLSVVWSVLRRFDEPQIYNKFVRNCFLRGDLRVGCLRDIRFVSGLPMTTTVERLEILDEEEHILSFSNVESDSCLKNYRLIFTLHERLINDKPGTIVIESYEVDIPEGSTREGICLFALTFMKLNLRSLASTSEQLTRNC